MNSLTTLVTCWFLLLTVVSCRNAAPTSTTSVPRAGVLNSQRVSEAEAPLVSLVTVLKDPSRFAGREIQVEGFVEHCEGGFILSPDLRSLVESLLPHLAYVDTLRCRQKGSLPIRDERGYYRLRGRVVDDKGEGSGRPSYKFTLLADQCVELPTRPTRQQEQ